MDPVTALSQCHGAARWSVLRSLGVTRYALKKATANGDIRLAGPGAYALPDADWAIVTATTRSGALGCVSGAIVHELWVWKYPRVPHILCARAVAPGNYVAHRVQEPARGLSPVPDCVAHALGCLPELEALVIAESAVVKGLSTLAELNAAVQGKGSIRARSILRRIDGNSQSLVETIARETFRAAGLTVTSQRRFDGVGKVDLWVEGKVVVELDGRDYHSAERDFVEDRRRWNELTLQQVPVLRFPAKMVLRNPEGVLETVQTLLSRLD